MSEKCVHNWYSRIVGFASSEFFCLICGKKLTITRMEEHATELEARIAELEGERRWIPVSERLPEDGEIVWLWDGKYIGMGYYLVFSGQFMDRDTPLRQIKVTHWMALPEPPEVQE